MHLLITGAWQDAQQYIPELEKRHEVVFLQQEREALPCDPTWVEGVVCNGLFLYHPIESFPNLRFIQLTSAGYDRVPMETVREKEIEIHNARGVYSVPMAEFAVAGVLSVYKGLAQFQRQQERRVWQKNRGLRELAGKTVVVVGCGDVGRECAKRFKAFGTNLIGVNRTVRPAEHFDEVVGPDRLDEVLPRADVAVVTVALTEETRGLVKARLLRPDAVLVNISRGGTVDLTDARCELLLDVFEDEPLDKQSPLWDADKVRITPHNSFVGEGNGVRLAELILSNLKDKL
jgi:phosphoglycerate dehydrogenase-like enzyme